MTLSSVCPANAAGAVRLVRSRASLGTALAALGLLAGVHAAQAQPAEWETSSVPLHRSAAPPIRIETIGMNPFDVPAGPSLPGPFQPRGTVVLYSRTAVQGAVTINFGTGGNPVGSGTQPDVWMDDVIIPPARLAAGGITSPLISVCQLQLAVVQFAGAQASDVSVWWTTLRNGPVAPDTVIDSPPQLAGTVSLPASATTVIRTVTIGDAVNPIPGMEAVPLNMNLFALGGVPTGALAVGLSFSNTTDENIGWLFTNPPDSNSGSFWIYDTDLPNPEAQFAFATPPPASFGIIVRGITLVPSTPQACCVPAAGGSRCFIAADEANCTQSGGVSVPGQSACGVNTCTAIVCCNNTTGVCSVVVGQTACPGMQVIQPGTTCTGVACTQPFPPANDECAAATPGSAFELTIPNQPARTTQTLVGATASAGFATGNSCTFADADVWYLVTLTPDQANQQFEVTYQALPSSGDFTATAAAVAVYDGGLGCPAGPGGELGCADFTTPNSVVFQANGSTSYFVRVAFFDPCTTQFDLSIAGVVTGACCNPTNGLCLISNNSGQCTQAGYTNYQGNGTTCANNPCPRGACCGTAGACAVTGSAGCDPASYLGDGSTCSPNNLCQGACCDAATGACTLVSNANSATECAAPNVYRGQATTCVTNTCAGACCATTGACTLVPDVTSTTACAAPSVYFGGGSVCIPNTCPQPAPPANDNCVDAVMLVVDAPAIPGNIFGATQDATPAAACTTSVLDVWYKFSHPQNANLRVTVDNDSGIPMSIAFYTTITPPATDPCGTTEVACQGAVDDPSVFAIAATGGTTVFARIAALTGGFSSFTIKVERVRTGACCEAPSGVCALSSDVGVCAAGTAYQGDGTVCQPANPCPQPANGACCRGSTCIVDAALQSAGACAATITGGATAGAAFVSTGPCGGTNHLSPCCYADYNKIGGRNVTDIFNYLTDWFAARPWAVVGGNGTGVPAVGHIFAFLTDWFAGGCP